MQTPNETLKRLTGRLFKPATAKLSPPTQRSIALVLSGGGARAFAHIGVLRALEEANIHIAQVGGTSAGAIIAAQIALGWDAEKIRRTMRRHFVECGSPLDYVLPFVALIDGKRFLRMLADICGDTQIEDLPRRFFCVSCNLSRAELVVHDRGLLRKALAASSAVPGVIPPIAHGDELLVDGGVLNNLPVDVMQQCAAHPLWAVDVGLHPTVETCRGYSASLPSWKIWWSRLNPFAETIQVPTAVDILMNTAMLASRRQTELNRQLADVCLRPPVEGFRTFDFRTFDQVVEIGYRFAQRAIAELNNAPQMEMDSSVSAGVGLNHLMTSRL
jgi:NTE family protein